jgi:hypothetical protein
MTKYETNNTNDAISALLSLDLSINNFPIANRVISNIINPKMERIEK